MEKKSYKNTNTNNSQPNKIRGGETNIMKNNMKKTLAVLSTTAMLAGVAAPAAVLMTPAQAVQAASPIEATGVPTIADDQVSNLGAIKLTVPAGSLRAGHSVIFKLPSDVDFPSTARVSADVYGYNGTSNVNAPSGINNYFLVPEYSEGTTQNGITSNDLQVVSIDANDEIQLQLKAGSNQSMTHDAVIYFRMDQVSVKDGFSGPVDVTVEAPSNSGFPYGKVTVAQVGSGDVILSTTDTQTGNNTFSFNLRIKETLANALESGDETLKLKLPDGFVWDSISDKNVINNSTGLIYGSTAKFSFNEDENELEINLDEVNGSAVSSSNNGSANPSLWDLNLSFRVDDESRIDSGDIMAKIYGETSVDAKELKVGQYGDFGVKVYAEEDIPTILSGKKDQEIAEINIDELLKETLIPGRTVQITLPEGAKWEDVDTDNDHGINLTNYVITNDEKTLKYTLSGSLSSDEAELSLSDMEVSLEAGFKGDLEVEVNGSAGVSGTIKVAEVVNPVTVEASSAPTVKIGVDAQEAGNITIKEEVAGAFEEDGKVQIVLPGGVEFTKLPTVKVTDGDLEIKNVTLSSDYSYVEFIIDNNSDEASTIEISDASLKLYRTVPEGALKVQVKGDALIETAVEWLDDDGTGHGTIDGWENSDVVADVAIATVGTPAPGESSADASFVIGNATYSVNGVEKAMDVAPFIKDGRTFLPVRYVAEAVGVSEDNLIWNQAAKTVTIMKGDRVAQLTIGSNILTVNGVQIPMDVKAAVVDGRTVLPLRYVAQALGAQVDYDEVTKTVSVK